MPNLTEADCAALAGLLRETIARDPFPLSARIQRLKTILAKRDPPRWGASI